jgi:hypothetical protein
MDRDLMFAVMVAVFGTALVGSFYFGEAPKPDPEAQVYAPNDIRYALQQQEIREREKAKKRKVKVSAPAPASDESPSDTEDSSIDQSSVTDHAPVGEPEIE